VFAAARVLSYSNVLLVELHQAAVAGHVGDELPFGESARRNESIDGLEPTTSDRYNHYQLVLVL
jgi:hypothetical protein